MAIKIKSFKTRDEAAASAEKSSGQGGGSWGIPKEGCTVRFLTDSTGFLGFYEYFDEEANTYVPVDEDDTLPEGVRMSFRYLAVVLWKSEPGPKDQVAVIKLPQKVTRKLFGKEKRYDGLSDRDYEFSKVGTGRDTEYDVDACAPERMALAKYTKEMPDLMAVLEAERSRAVGLINENGGHLVASSTTTDDEPKAKSPSKTKAPAAKATKAAAKPAAKDDDDDLTDLGEVADGDTDDADEAQDKLTELAEAAGIDPDDYGTWAELAEVLAEGAPAEVEPEDEPEEEEAEDDTDITAEVQRITELGAEADDGDDDAMEELTNMANEVGLDPDDYAAWAELAALLIPNGGGDEDVELDLDELEAMSARDLRKLATELGIEVKSLTTPAKLIAAIVAAAEE